MTNELLFLPKDRKLLAPRLLGRVGRLIFGLWSLYFVREAITYWEFFVESPQVLDQVGYLMGVALAFWLMPDVINIGINRRWKRRSQIVWLIVALLAIAANLIFIGDWWGPLLGWTIWLMAVFVHLYLGASHVLSAIIGTPGCEMRSLPHLRAILGGSKVEMVVCPGHWTAFDSWEASLSNNS
jgi:hypothetical protein